MNLPNRLTISRICLVPVFAVFAHLASGGRGPVFYLLAGAVFALASLTDALDGHIARKNNLITNFGKFADPLADKILTTAAFIYMLREGVCHPAVLILILFREFAVSGLRMLSAGAKEGVVIPANLWGKMKTVGQMLTILLFYFGCGIAPGAAVIRPVSAALCWVCALLTVISGLTYFAAARGVLSEK